VFSRTSAHPSIHPTHDCLQCLIVILPTTLHQIIPSETLLQTDTYRRDALSSNPTFAYDPIAAHPVTIEGLHAEGGGQQGDIYRGGWNQDRRVCSACQVVTHKNEGLGQTNTQYAQRD